MSDHALGSDFARARRIHELERAADEQRAQLAASAAELGKSFGALKVLGSLAGSVSPRAIGGVLGARGWLAPALGFLWRHFRPDAGQKTGASGPPRRKIPWVAAGAAAVSLARVGFWLARKRR